LAGVNATLISAKFHETVVQVIIAAKQRLLDRMPSAKLKLDGRLEDLFEFISKNDFETSAKRKILLIDNPFFFLSHLIFSPNHIRSRCSLMVISLIKDFRKNIKLDIDKRPKPGVYVALIRTL
jgi:thymidine kinase